MRSSLGFRRLTIVLLLALGAGFFFAAYKAIDNIVAEQSRVQQEAISPVYDLVSNELLRPLAIAETFASSIEFTAAMDAEGFDETLLLESLRKMEQDLELVFFVASDRTRKQYISNGRVLDLIEGKVSWYFDAMEQDKDFYADLGQVGDVHLYFDVRMVDGDGAFLGYVGVGKRLQRFLETFDQYKARYGYDFLFVNEKNEIILTSLPDLVVTDAYIPTLESLHWFAGANGQQLGQDGEIIELEQGGFLISEFGIEELGWRLLLLVPLEARQAQVTKAFITNALAAMVIVILLVGALLYLMLLNRQDLEKKTEIDPLTGLPNRIHIARHFSRLRREGTEVCAAIIDLDHFKAINDTHGHDAGDRVLKMAASTFQQGLREKDIVGRWGGEEFVMLIPAASIDEGRVVAERARRNLEVLSIETLNGIVAVTASFGVAFGSARNETLDELLARADDALYQAKERGRNRVVLHQT